jgi:hypothetical protein
MDISIIDKVLIKHNNKKNKIKFVYNNLILISNKVFKTAKNLLIKIHFKIISNHNKKKLNKKINLKYKVNNNIFQKREKLIKQILHYNL